MPSGRRPDRVPVALVGNGLANEPEFIANFGDYDLHGRLAARGDTFKLVSLHVSTSDEAAEVTGATLRSIEVAKLVHAARALVARAAEFWTPASRREIEREHGVTMRPLPKEVVQAVERQIRRAASKPLRRGSAGYGDDHYRRIALAYLRALEAGRTRGVLAQIAADESRRLGREVPVETVRTWVKIARDRQFLTAGEPGRAGAMPGPRLYHRGPR